MGKRQSQDKAEQQLFTQQKEAIENNIAQCRDNTAKLEMKLKKVMMRIKPQEKSEPKQGSEQKS